MYNVEKYLKKCIDSIINQTYTNLEIILVDDGSLDKCGEICDEYAKQDNRIKVIHNENEGVARAREIGIEQASGEFIGFVDSDDYLEVSFYEKLYNAIIRYNADWVACNMVKVYKDGSKCNIPNSERILENRSIIKQEEFFEDLTNNMFYTYVLWDKLYKTEFVKGYKFKKLRISEDTCFMIDLFCKTNKAYLLNYYGYNYVQRADSVTATETFRKENFDRLKAWRYIEGVCRRKYPKYELYVKEKINALLRDIYIQLITKGSRGDIKLYKSRLRKMIKNRIIEQRKNKEAVSKKIRIHFFLVTYMNWLYDCIILVKEK